MLNNLLRKYLTSQKIPRLTNVSTHLFNSNIADQYPIVIEDVVTNWQAYTLWTYDYLKKEFGNYMVEAYKDVGSEKQVWRLKLSEFIDYSIDADTDNPYYMNFSFHVDTKLAQHYKAPDYFHCWYKKQPKNEQRTILSWIFLGARHTFSHLHLDIWGTSAWNALLAGRKLWIFYSPEQSKHLYDGLVNPIDPDYNKFPDYKMAKPMICIQKPGDLVYTPSKWFHAVYNLDLTLAITENFINEYNYKWVKQYFQKNASYQALKKLECLRKKYHN